MKINNIFRFALCMVALASVTTSCRFEEDDLFDLPASQRQEHSKNEVRDILVSASKDGQYGWLLQYFVSSGGNGSYPGFNMFCKFYNSGCVTIGGDHEYVKTGAAGVYMEFDSYYEVNKDEATTIALTTWNNVLTPFVNPDASGVGMYGDCNFIVMGYNNDEILLRGTRHSARSRLYRLDRPIDQYIAEANARKALISNPVTNPYSVKKAGEAKSVYIVDLQTGRLSMRDDAIDPMNKSDHALVFTPEGFRTETACKSFDKSYEFQEFVYDAEKDVYAEKSDHSITLDVSYPNANDFFVHSTNAKKKWKFDVKSELSEDMKTLLTAVANASSSFSGHTYSLNYDKATKKSVLNISFKKSSLSKQVEYTFDVVRTEKGFQLTNPELTNNQGINDTAGKKLIPSIEALVAKFTNELYFTDSESKWTRNTLRMNFSADSYVIVK